MFVGIARCTLLCFISDYCKFPKYSDTQNICCNHSKIWIMWLYHRVMCPDDADGMANSVDPDQTAPLGSLIWVCTVCPGISVRDSYFVWFLPRGVSYLVLISFTLLVAVFFVFFFVFFSVMCSIIFTSLGEDIDIGLFISSSWCRRLAAAGL